MARMSRDKGKRGEREVVHVFKAAGIQAERTAPMQAGSTNYADIHIDVPGYHIESKMAAQIRIVEWVRQATREANPLDVPVVAWRLCARGNSTGWMATLPLEDFAVLVKRSTL